MLVEAVEAADAEINFDIIDDLSPNAVLDRVTLPSIVTLNYQAALHSRWQPQQIREVQARGSKVLVIFHDTGVPNSDRCKAVVDAADVTIVHEPCDDLPAEKVRYWRMGVPAWSFPIHAPVPNVYRSWEWQPTLGSVGFPFPWKNYDELARVTAACGWALLLLAPNATETDCRRWATLNPHLYVRTDFLPRATVISHLAGCDATAFLYTCANTGQSGAILQGIAARKPVIALRTCRQNRALFLDDLGNEVIRWCDTFEDVASQLRHLCLGRLDPGIVALAEQESWTKLGAKYATLYRELQP